MKTYTKPTIIAQGSIVQHTEFGTKGTGDPANPIDGQVMAVGSTGFGL